MLWILFADDKLEIRRVRLARKSDNVDASSQVFAVDIDIIRLARQSTAGN